MKYTKLSIPDVILLETEVFGDDRGFFMETFRESEFIENCGDFRFVQDNHSSSGKGILRGMHYQHEKPQGKLVRVVKGEVFDVAVDMRANSPTLGQWVGEYLSEDNKRMLWVPPGFAHGFMVTSEQADFVYKCTDYYNPGDEYSLLWNDDTVGIEWPQGIDAQLSDKDAKGLMFSACPKF
ncbi:dTDP-4-dehydrorhamnose 3,5-epimerase [Psychrobacter sp.]|uniref:dTDP-4-dehydrorhamnose 3,5-epimerase n=1 Tax=Psychrobacter sp. TaxID=56811 RepID=UPI003F995D70